MPRIKIKASIGDSDYDEPRRAYPIDEYREEGNSRSLRRTTFLPERREPRATAERYVRKVKIEEVTTNDSTVSLQGALRSTYDFMQLGFAVGLAAAGFYYLGETVAFLVRVGLCLGMGIAGYMVIKHLRSGGGDDGEGR